MYLIPSLDTQDPRKRFKAKKCIQKISKKVSVANTVYKLSKLKYNLKTSNIGSSNKIALIDYINIGAVAKMRGKTIELTNI